MSRLLTQEVTRLNNVCYFNLPNLGVISLIGASQVALVVKNPPANEGDLRDAGSIPGSGKSPEVGNGNPPQYSCLENSMDKGA